MKKILNSKTILLFGIFLSYFVVSITSCKNDDNMLPYVDLRYNPDDSYTVAASSPQTVEFEVSSTFPWEILSKGNWHTIAPASGMADSVYKVKIVCQENTSLDDRIDTIIIKSDHWIGKKFELIQKGTAWLQASEDTIPVSKEDGLATFEVASNQDWTCEVTDGAGWLSITDGAKGTLNGTVNLAMKENKGEMRYGIITVFDRHHVEATKVYIEQNGVLLQAEKTELREIYFDQTVTFNVRSNTKWKISKSEYDVWYTVESGVEYEGDATVELHLTKNEGLGMRKSEITLESVSDDPNVPSAVRTIILKQANKPEPETYAFNSKGYPQVSADGSLVYDGKRMLCSGGQARRVFEGMTPVVGTHVFRVARIDAGASPHHYIMAGGTEFRFHILENKKIEISQTSKKVNVYDGKGNLIIDASSGNSTYYFPEIDTSQPHDIMFTISDADGKMKVEFAIDDIYAPLAYSILDAAPTSNINLYVGGQPGYCEYDWAGYITPMNWDN